jgi:NAD dependent epimerase/dehydratase
MISWKNTPVVVTGAGGFIGSHLVEKLVDLGARVTAFVRYNSRNDAGVLQLIGEKKQQLQVVAGDIRDLETVRSLVNEAEVIFHLAALVGIPYSYLHTGEVVEVNTMGSFNVLTAAKDRGVKKLVMTSTSEVYGSAIYTPINEAHPKQPQSPYSASKIAADAIALSFYNAFDLPVAIVRPFNTYGPRQSDRAIIPTIISQALTTRQIHVGNTDTTRDFTFVTDTVDGMIKVAESDKSLGQEINLGSGQEISIGELAESIRRIVGNGVEIHRDAQRLRPAKSEVSRLLSANAKARELVGWVPKVTLKEGLSLTTDWIRNHLNLYDPTTYRI